MGKKSSPAQPAAPDPAATAKAQEQTNIGSAIAQANLNRIDQVTPEGSLKYTQNGVNDDGTPRYTQTQTLSPDEQAKYDQANKVALSLGDLAGNNISRVQDAQATPFTYNGMTPLQTSVTPGTLQAGPEGGPMQSYVPTRTVQNSVDGAGTAKSIDGGEAGSGIQRSLDYSGLTKLPGTDDFSADAKRVSDSVYQQAASRLDPQWAQNDNDVKAQLAAQGISENSDAYRRAYDNLSRAKNDAYSTAQNTAQQAGSAEQSRIFGLAMSARQQGKSEVDTQGNFVNAAQGQGFEQKLSAADQAAKVQAQNFGQKLDNAQLYNASEQQLHGQDSDNAALFNAAQAQKFGQDATKVGIDNSNQTTAFNQDAANLGTNNSARQQQIQEASYLRNLPLNDIAALLGTGPGVAQPDFQPVSQVGVAAPDYAGMVGTNYAQQMAAYNTQQQARSTALGSIFGAAGKIGAAWAGSDIRFKENIRRIGTLANGLATYAFNYIGHTAQQFGVMAQEVLNVIPDAVASDRDGFMYVDYGKVY